MYCGEDDIVCCTVCIAVDHRSCKGVDFIPKVARGIYDREDRQEVKTSLEIVHRELEQLKSKKMDELSGLNSTLEEILKEIDSLKKRILIKLETLEKQSVSDVRARHKEIADKLNDDVSTVDAMLKTLDAQLDKISHLSNDDEAKLFIQIKSGQKLNISLKTYIEWADKKDAETILYQMNTAVENVLNENRSLISLEIGSLPKRFKASLEKQIKVRVQGDAFVCRIYDICPIDDGQIVITDFNNNELKRLDATGIMTDVLEIPGNPLGICSIECDQLAVTLWGRRKVQFVSVGQSMSLTRSFDVPVHCKGIAYCEKRLFISFFGKGIGVYDLSGKIIRVFETDQKGVKLFSNPCLLKFSSDGMTIRVADFGVGLVTISRQGKKITKTTAQNLENAFGVCESSCGQIFVSGWGSDNVIQIDKNGTVLHELLNTSYRIKSPLALTYLSNPARLLVTASNSDEIKVFRLN